MRRPGPGPTGVPTPLASPARSTQCTHPHRSLPERLRQACNPRRPRHRCADGQMPAGQVRSLELKSDHWAGRQPTPQKWDMYERTPMHSTSMVQRCTIVAGCGLAAVAYYVVTWRTAQHASQRTAPTPTVSPWQLAITSGVAGFHRSCVRSPCSRPGLPGRGRPRHPIATTAGAELARPEVWAAHMLSTYHLCRHVVVEH